MIFVGDKAISLVDGDKDVGISSAGVMVLAELTLAFNWRSCIAVVLIAASPSVLRPKRLMGNTRMQ